MLDIGQIKGKAKSQMSGKLGLLIGIFIVGDLLVSAASGTLVAGLLIAGPIELGYIICTLKIARGGSPKFSEMFNGFNSFVEAFATALLRDLFISLWSLLLFIPGIIKSYSYALTMYILHDNPNVKYSDAITLSRKMMDGYKGKMFLMHLSFIGWHLLGIITFGLVEILYVVPYVNMADANFYEEVKAEYEKKNAPQQPQEPEQPQQPQQPQEA